MTIKKRLAISNLLMLIVPAMLVVMVSVGALALFIGFYWDSIRDIAQNQGSVIAVKNVLDLYRHQSADDTHGRTLAELETLLSGMGYRLRVEENGAVIRSNLSHEDNQAVGALSVGFPNGEDSIVFLGGSTALVRGTFTYDQRTLTLTAVSGLSSLADSNLARQAQRFLSTYIWAILGATLLVVALTNGILSSRVAKSVLQPLRLLGDSARRIRDGDLNFTFSYKGNDEFKDVCDDFDAMRTRLLDSVRSQLKEEEDRREFIAGVSHDLRTPLTAIKGYVEGLRDGVANTPEKQIRYLDTIYRKACGMELLVDRLFLLSKLETGHFPFRFARVDLRDYLTRFLDSIREEFDAKGLSLAFEDGVGGAAEMLLDAEQMRWVLLNLLENSAKYKDKARGQVTVTLSVAESIVRVTVADDGPGVSPEMLSKMFYSFFRGDPSRSDPISGSGLGLAIAKRIVEAHQGSIWAINQNGLSIIMEFNQIGGTEN